MEQKQETDDLNLNIDDIPDPEEKVINENTQDIKKDSSKEAKESKKSKKKDKKDEQIEELTDKLKRSMAEFENFRKRTEKEKSAMYDMGAKCILEKLLQIVDNFERGIGTLTQEQLEDPFTQGVDKIYKQLLTMLDEVNVKQIEALDKEFNPDFHNAVMHVEDEDSKENVIIEEFQKGYMYKDSVLRYSMVKVAN